MVISMLYSLKWVPERLWWYLRWQLSVVLIVHNEDPAFERVSEWLATLEYVKRARTLRLTSQEEYSANKEVFYSPGIGVHVFRHNGRLLMVTRDTPKDSSSSWKRREDIHFRMLGRSTGPMHDLIQEIVKARGLTRQTKTDIYLYQDYWSLACRKDKRSLDTVFLPEEQKQRIVQDVETFLERKEWYAQRGIPYRRGLLFKGPPGCGKTSMVLALAAHFSKPIYVLNLGSIKSDNDLFRAVTRTPDEAILLIEDIDAAKTSVARSTEPKPPNADKDEAPPLSLSGLLNAIDGTFARDGRILIMTTNHPDKIDPALIRPGRIDLKEHIGYLEDSEIKAMCQKFLGDRGVLFAQKVEHPVTPADLQNILLSLKEVA